MLVLYMFRRHLGRIAQTTTISRDDTEYTGWCDVNLTKKGQLEARTAGRLLYENGIELDQGACSVLANAVLKIVILAG